jgi:hypothetical protein
MSTLNKIAATLNCDLKTDPFLDLDLSGQWPAQIPFFQTVNALARSRLNLARRQLAKALVVLLNTQNRDGSWGNEDHEWNTFLVVHALKNKGFL